MRVVRSPLRSLAGPQQVGERTPRVPEIGPAGEALELPVGTHERPEIRLDALAPPLLEDTDVPRARVDLEFGDEDECAVAQLRWGGVDTRHATAIGTRPTPYEALPPDGVTERRHTSATLRPPTVIEPGRLIAGRHPCAWGPEDAGGEVRALLDTGVTLFLDLTEGGELEPYASFVEPPARYLNAPIRDFSVPTRDGLAATLDVIDAELARGGLVYVHCWAGCGRTGVVVGSWLVRHGVDAHDALRRIAETRGPGCPQTLEQRAFVLGWQPEL